MIVRQAYMLTLGRRINSRPSALLLIRGQVEKAHAMVLAANIENILFCRELRSREVAAAGLPVGVLPSVVDEQVALIRLRDC
jgi:hypothetical protein